MPRDRLELLWWVTVALYTLAVAVIVVARSTGDGAGVWGHVAVWVAIGGFWASLLTLRPRPFQAPDVAPADRRSATATLRALRRGQPAGPSEQQRQAIDASRRSIYGGLIVGANYPILGLNNLTDPGEEDWTSLVAAVGIVLVGFGLLAARWRMAQLGRWERRTLDHRAGTPVTTPESRSARRAR